MEGFRGVPRFLQAVSETLPLTGSQTLHSTRFPVYLLVLPIDPVPLLLGTYNFMKKNHKFKQTPLDTSEEWSIAVTGIYFH